MLGREDLEECFDLALRSGLTDPQRRSLLLAWLPPGMIGHLPSMNRPADQLFSDVRMLNGLPLPDGRPAIAVWLENAERLVSYLPGVADRLRRLRKRAEERGQEGIGPTHATNTRGVSPSTGSTPPTATTVTEATIKGPPKLGVLFLSAQPKGARGQRLSKLLHGVRDQIRTNDPDRLDLSSVHSAVEAYRIAEIIEESTHEVLHFAGQGERRSDSGGWLVIQGHDGQAVYMHPESTADLIREGNEERVNSGAPPLRCAIFSADYSAALAELIVNEGLVKTAIGHTSSVRDEDVRAFSRRFYQKLAQGRSFAEAFEAGRRQVAIQRSTSARKVTDLKIFSA